MRRSVVHATCKCCNSDRRNEIDAMLIRGDSPEKVAKAMGNIMSPASVRRHRARHLTEVLPMRLDNVKIARHSDLPTLAFGDIVEQIRELYNRARATLEDAEETQDAATAIKANAQALRCLESYVRVADTTYKLSARSDKKNNVMELSNIVLEALASHPAAKLDVIKALQKAEIGDDRTLN